MAAPRWSEDKSTIFVTIFEKYDRLWNSQHELYKNKDARISAIKDLIVDMRAHNIHMTEEDVRIRIKTVRTTYLAELRKIERAKMSGESYVPTCSWFNLIDRYLRKFANPRTVHNMVRPQKS